MCRHSRKADLAPPRDSNDETARKDVQTLPRRRSSSEPDLATSRVGLWFEFTSSKPLPGQRSASRSSSRTLLGHGALPSVLRVGIIFVTLALLRAALDARWYHAFCPRPWCDSAARREYHDAASKNHL